MSDIAKYNVFKSISLLLTSGAPVTAVALCSDFIIKDSNASVSLVAAIAIMFSVLFMKDKIMEKFKMPSPLIISIVLLVLITVAEHIILPLKTACIVTAIACGVDELTFKHIYKGIELRLPQKAQGYKHFGFLCCKSAVLEGVKDE